MTLSGFVATDDAKFGRKRFFAQDMFSGFERGFDGCEMRVIGRGDADRFDRFIV
jgi:hypothetical protein